MTTLPRAYCVKNNSSQEITPEKFPWQNTVSIPKFPDKNAYRKWCSRPDTDYCFFSLIEPEVSSLRVGAGNKPHRIHGIVADYDCAGLTADEVARGLTRIPGTFPAHAWNRTFSGGVRIVWLFEVPVFYYSPDVWKKFIKRCVKELKLKSIFAGLDDHIEMAELYYCAGSDWTVNLEAKIRETLLNLWVYDCCKTEKFSDGIEVPLERVEAEMHKKFPDRWKGDFVDGARGVRFWDPTGDAVSAIVRPTGMVAFTGNDAFLSWERIFGREFISSYLEDRRGKAIAEMYSDGDTYYRKLPNNTWDPMATEATRRHLKVVYGLTDKTSKGDDASEIDAVLNHLEQRKRVTGALPFPLNPNDVVVWNGSTFLNNSNARLWPAHPEAQEWGIGFPWTAQYLTSLFLDQQNLEAFLSWLHVWVKSAHAGKPCRGQSLFIVGPVGTGKSLLTRQVISRIFGGYADGRDHLVDGGRFNSTMFERACWLIDDSTALADQKAHARFSSLVKAVVANDSFQYEQKYGYSGAVPFVGRLIITLNDDPLSLGILPDLDQSLIDKVILLKTDSLEAEVAATETERYEVIDRELSAFVRFLVDYEMPEWVKRDNRFGIKAWHDPSVLMEARKATPSQQTLEMLDTWRVYASAVRDKKAWSGSSTTLYELLDQDYPAIIRKMTPATLGKHINQIIASGVDWVARENRKGKKGERRLTIKHRIPDEEQDKLDEEAEKAAKLSRAPVTPEPETPTQ